MAAIPFSILDLVPITAGGSAAQALENSLDLAQHAERWGYRRYWLAEHHNMPGVASSATPVVIAHIAGGTSTLRVGAGGVMLPNHAPLVVAEQFGTLASLHPGRIDLGLGRAPGTDPLTARALRRDQRAGSFPQDLTELMSYFEPERPNQTIRAVPGAGLDVPIWLLGSSLHSAEMASAFGLPFAFAAHFAPELMLEALATYRRDFCPSPVLQNPYAMVCTNVFAADSDEEARRLFSSLEQAFAALERGQPGQLPPPREPPATQENQAVLAVHERFRYAIVGGRESVERGVADFLRLSAADEFMATAMIFDHSARLRSFEILAGVRDRLAAS